MSEPLDIDTILSEFSEEDTAWVLREEDSGKNVLIPHSKYPGRNIFHFFLSELDAKRLIDVLMVESPALRGRRIAAYEVRLKQALRGIDNSGNADDGFVVHTPNEVFDFLWNRDSDV